MAWATCKFELETRDTEDGYKYPYIVVELLPGIEPDAAMVQVIAASIRAQLLRLNSEFANYTPAERQLPRITLSPFADAEYFPVGVKHRYTRR